MKKWFCFALPVLLVAGLAAACGDDDEGPSGPSFADLAGSWRATTTVFTLNADPSVTLDIVQTLGAVVDLVLVSDGSFVFDIDVPGLGLTQVTGSYTLDGNTATVINDAEPNDPLTGTFTLSTDGNTLTIRINDTTLFDLTQDGIVDEADAARLDGVFDRQS